MEWFIFLLIFAIVLYLFAAFQFYQFWKGYKNLNIGDFSNEFREESRKRIRVAIILFVIGGILNLVGIFIRP